MAALEKSHVFEASPFNVIICNICKKDMAAHWKPGTCEVCGAEENVTLMYGNMTMCGNCAEKEKKAYAENMSPEKQQERVDAMHLAQARAREIDNSITVRTDLFNAATVSIVELKQMIDSNESITNKPYALAEELTNRFNHYKQVVFEMNEKIVEAGNQQKAIQVYLNQLANSLRQEEREKLKIADINYKPPTVKPVKPAAIKTASKKLDKAELRKYATELGIPEFTLQMLVVSKGITVEQAANMLRKSIAEAKSEAN
jgi:hypothetical protein